MGDVVVLHGVGVVVVVFSQKDAVRLPYMLLKAVGLYLHLVALRRRDAG